MKQAIKSSIRAGTRSRRPAPQSASTHSPCAGRMKASYSESGRKGPRYNGKPMQVGPLAQVLIGYAQGHPLTKKYADLPLGQVWRLRK